MLGDFDGSAHSHPWMRVKQPMLLSGTASEALRAYTVPLPPGYSSRVRLRAAFATHATAHHVSATFRHHGLTDLRMGYISFSAGTGARKVGSFTSFQWGWGRRQEAASALNHSRRCEPGIDETYVSQTCHSQNRDHCRFEPVNGKPQDCPTNAPIL